MTRRRTSSTATLLGFAFIAVAPLAATGQQQRPESPAMSADRVMAVRSVVGGEAPQWSPDGTRLLFTSSLGGGNGLWSVAADGGFPTMLVPDIGGIPYQMPQSPRWSPAGDWVAYISGKGGPAGAPDQPGPSDLWLWSSTEGREIQLTRMGARIGSFSWSPDGKWIAFSGGLGGSYDIWKVAVPGGEAYRLTSDPRYELTPTWTPDGSKLLFVRTDDHWVEHEIIEILADGTKPRVVTRDADFFDYNTSGTPSFGPPLLSPDGKTVLFKSWRTGWVNFWTVPLVGGEPRILASESADQSAGAWSPDGKSIAYASNRNGTHVLSVAPAAGGPPRVVVNPPMGVVANPAWSPDGKRLSYTLVTPTRAADLYVATVETGAARQLTFSGAETSGGLITPEKITYRSDSLTIHAYLYKPANLRPGERAPGIVFAHGGPTGQYGDTYDVQMQFFARQGYVVLAPNFRGGSGYGRAFADLNNKCWAHCDLKDLVAGVEYLKTLPYVNPNKMGVTGTSHGGLLSMAAATFAPGVFQASVAHGGTADRIHYYNTQELRHIKQAENEFGPLKGNEDTYRYVSPFYFAKDVNTPIFVIWGEGRYPGSDNSRLYVDELERNYKWVRYKVYTGENYYVSGRANTRQMLIDMQDFFDQYLRDKIMPSPAPGPLP